MKKNTMKKLMALACAGVMALSLAACGGNGQTGSAGNETGADGVKSFSG